MCSLVATLLQLVVQLRELYDCIIDLKNRNDCKEVWCLCDLIILLIATICQLLYGVLCSIVCILINAAALAASNNPCKPCLCIILDLILSAVTNALQGIVTAVGKLVTGLSIDVVIGCCKSGGVSVKFVCQELIFSDNIFVYFTDPRY